MYKLLVPLAALFCLGNFQKPLPKYDYVRQESIQIIRSNHNAYLLGSAQQLQKAFGKAHITKEADEVLGGNAYIYHYNGAEVYFNEKNFETIDVTSNAYTVYLNGESYNVGDDVRKLKIKFPQAYKDGRKEHRIWASLTFKNQVMDTYVSIDLDKTDHIKSITISNDNS